MNFNSRDIALTAVFTALYVVINILEIAFSGGPAITFGPIQLRIADALIPLAALFGWPVVGGVTIGCLLTNAYFGMPIDIILGPIANLVAASLILYLRRRRLLACIIGALPIGLIVGGYLWLLLPPEAFGSLGSVLPIWLASITSITISSLIAVSVLGYILLSVLSRPNIVGPLKSRGLKVLDQK